MPAVHLVRGIMKIPEREFEVKDGSFEGETKGWKDQHYYIFEERRRKAFF
jgi:hypothetical protein